MAFPRLVKIKQRANGSASVLSSGSVLSLALCLSLCLSIGCRQVLADTLKGNIEETGVSPAESTFNPAVPMAVPVMKKKKLQGTADDNALKGQADDTDSRLEKMMGQMDDSGHLKGSAQDDDRSPLKATLTQDQLQSEDPDKDDQMLAVEWDKWHNRLLRSIQNGLTEIVNSRENMVPHFDPNRGVTVFAPNVPLGTKATFWVKVSKDKRVLDAKILQSSGNPGYDKSLLDAIYSLDGSTILKYPSGSRRQVVNEAASIFCTDKASNQDFKFGDVERYRVP